MAREAKKVIAFVLYPGIDALDLAGPLTVLRDLKPRSPIRTVVVSGGGQPVTTNTPLGYAASTTFANAPDPYALFVPGGGHAAQEATKDQALLAYVREAAAKAEVIGSFGNGALILAAAGVLDDRPVAVHWAWREELERLGARASGEMWVDDGRQLTAAGGSSGMDLMLALNARLKSRADSLFAQLAMEYDPEPPFGPLQRTPDPDLEAAVRSGHVTANPDAKTMALVLYPNLTLLDLVGPLQVLAILERLDPRFRTVVVADQIAPMTTDLPLRAVADASFSDVPHPEVIVVPGGRQGTIRAMSDPAIRAYVESSAASAELVTSVCTGSLILGAAGLLQGRPATTNWFFYGLLNQFGAHYRRQRWVHDGNIIMSAGVSAGIDMALYLVALLTDQATARRVQLAVDYDPHPPYGGIDWKHIPTMPRMLREGIALMAPLLARKAKRLSRRAATEAA